MTDREKNLLILPDEAEYPPALTASYELIELFSNVQGIATLLARSRSDGEKVTVKCFYASHPLYDHSEPEALKKLNVPPLPRYLGEYKNSQMRCVLHQYVEGETLAAKASRCRLSTQEIVNIGIQLCDQLAALHGTDPPIIHRDVKPQNIIIRKDGSPVLIDFGIARSQSENDSDTAVFGTRGFAPPEQYGYSQTDSRSDLYSLGMVLHWLLQGDTQPPKSANTPLEKVILRMTAFDPARRYASALLARQALLNTLPGNRHRRKILTIAAILLIAIAGLCILPVVLINSRQAVFSHPLIASAVRLSLGLSEGAPVPSNLLPEVKELYIVANTAYTDADAFYAAINQWYADGKPHRGDIKTLDDLALFPNLMQAGVVAQELTDISSLSSLQYLSLVEFKHNYIQDISPLADKDRLTTVGLNDNPVRDLSPLLSCPNLSILDLCDVRNYDASIIGQMGNYDYLDLSNPTDSYKYLGKKSVCSLRLAWTGLTTLEDLNNVTRLETLDISHTSVVDLSPLAVHTGLRELNIAGTNVDTLTPLLSLPHLESVILNREMEPLVQALGTPPFEIRYE